MPASLGTVVGERHSAVSTPPERRGECLEERPHGRLPSLTVLDRQDYRELAGPGVDDGRGGGVQLEDVADHGVSQEGLAGDVRGDGGAGTGAGDEAPKVVGIVAVAAAAAAAERRRVGGDSIPARTPAEPGIVNLPRRRRRRCRLSAPAIGMRGEGSRRRHPPGAGHAPLARYRGLNGLRRVPPYPEARGVSLATPGSGAHGDVQRQSHRLPVPLADQILLPARRSHVDVRHVGRDGGHGPSSSGSGFDARVVPIVVDDAASAALGGGARGFAAYAVARAARASLLIPAPMMIVAATQAFQDQPREGGGTLPNAGGGVDHGKMLAIVQFHNVDLGGRRRGRSRMLPVLRGRRRMRLRRRR
mmetsp:Transcript_264/g.615  ORF Transcript_264/g.615 Transcript_264/m.615 type:complete len:360 (-) Transcript_264:58-1137(-)